MMRDRPPATAPPFALRREVAVAYLAPSLTAGLGGILRGDPELTLAAFTSIGLTSAAVAAATGLWLRRRGRPRPGGPPRWTATVPRPALAAGVAAFAAVLAAAAGWLAAGWLPSHTPVPDPAWPGRLRTDLPLSAALAAGVLAWRWRATVPSPVPGRPAPRTVKGIPQ
ncbi:hypothetical protein [Streptomyces clavuligerus]|uniref:Uncharacterized protein n=1 Tax=Streptomyces clavuligerus TaxID=1901 RepID=D5SM38_STRCL|nr:hypothetical protein [Streptomyces clavuligerus]EFG04981.1 Hypothetical protein SCLAV_p1499 [Streptomyces clavuligerus]MBY6306592.1 hypothetical protein [Streptomyces clavuligerus]QCS10801.1 hypothetical protein CRV15_35405 [Streptomyces clavuligerus]QPJ97164.1 hypothetical protein GE265_29080 [Streptomyces clavuligerus]WDN57507.1 hypothetical protein LL058_37740 [Streptomyces clavuligerus]